MEDEANAVSDEVVGPRGQEARYVQESTQLKELELVLSRCLRGRGINSNSMVLTLTV